MAKPFFMSSTERPPEKQLLMGNDELVVKQVSSLSAEDKAVLEQTSGIEILTDADLARAKAKSLQNSAIKSNTSFNGKPVVAAPVSAEDAEIAAAEKELASATAANDACFGRTTGTCGWMDLTALKDRLNLAKYSKALNDLVNSALKSLNDSILGSVLNCAQFLLTAGLNKVNLIANTIADLSSPGLLNTTLIAIKTRLSPSALIESKFPNLTSLIGKTYNNVRTAFLNVTTFKETFNIFTKGPTALLSPNGLSGFFNLNRFKYITHLFDAPIIYTPNRPKLTFKKLTSPVSPQLVDTNRMGIISKAMNDITIKRLIMAKLVDIVGADPITLKYIEQSASYDVNAAKTYMNHAANYPIASSILTTIDIICLRRIVSSDSTDSINSVIDFPAYAQMFIDYINVVLRDYANDISEQSLSMSQAAGYFIEDGNVPNAILPKSLTTTIDTSGVKDAMSLASLARNTLVGNNDMELSEIKMANRIRLVVNNGALNRLSNPSNIRYVPAIANRPRVSQRRRGITKQDNTNAIEAVFFNKYAAVSNRYS